MTVAVHIMTEPVEVDFCKARLRKRQDHSRSDLKPAIPQLTRRAKSMARPCVARRNVERGERESCINVSDLWCGALMLRARMGIRAHPTLTSG